MRGRVLQHPDVHERQLQQVLRKLAVRIPTAVDGLVPLQEVHGRRRADLELQDGEDRDLHPHDVLPGVGLVGDVHEVVDLRWVQFLELCSHEQGCDASKLQVPAVRAPPLQESVEDANGEEKGLRPEFVLFVHVDEPVHEDGAHAAGHLRLALHVVWVRELLPLVLLQVPVDVSSVLSHVLRVLGMRLVHVDIPVRRQRRWHGCCRCGLARWIGGQGLGAAGIA
mmetsp:Transcript_37370/g.111626  ORF Transcript_37370/g.111626 Transcript_37370/m.111626 type:complete len:224 (-) Transcript_37370:449-1120(-)